MTNSFDEFARAKMFMVIGSNMTQAHPVAATFIKNAVMNGAELIVIDPRKHALVDFASIHVQLKAGTDIAFLNALMNVIIEENLFDRKFVESCTIGLDDIKKNVVAYTPEISAEICGIQPELIVKTARKAAAAKPLMLCYTLGITEHTCGTNNVLAIANLQMLLGNMGIECGGVNPLRGQNNVQGACDMGALPDLLPGYNSVTDRKALEKFEKAWGIEKLPDKKGIMIPQILEGLESGKIKAFYIFGENIANSEPDIRKVEKELASAEFIVCQDIFHTETACFAHVILPSAAWSENEGTFTNSERRVSMVRKASEPPGDAKPNWWIFREIARRMGHEWESDSAKEIWDNEISKLAPQLKGIKYNRLEKNGLQWPCPDETHPGVCILHEKARFTCGLGVFNPVEWTAPAEMPDAEYPFMLSTGRRLYHYHTRTQTGRCEGLNNLMPEEMADISVEDSKILGIKTGDTVNISSRRGCVSIKAKITDEVPKGMIWMSFHFRDTCANWLTNPVYDPVSHTAEYKVCAVRIEKILSGISC